jgi:hypothetical protein
MWGFLLIMTARAVGIFLDSGEVRQQETNRFGANLGLLLLLVLLTAFVPIPPGGLTPEVVAAAEVAPAAPVEPSIPLTEEEVKMVAEKEGAIEPIEQLVDQALIEEELKGKKHGEGE